MKLTSDIIAKVRNYARKVTRSDKHGIRHEDIAQEALLALHRYDKPVEHLSSFIYMTVTNEFLEYIRRNEKVIKDNQCVYEYYTYNLGVDDQYDVSIAGIMDLFKSNPAKRKVLDLILKNPDLDYQDIADLNGINANTFKANLLHVRNQLKAMGITYQSYTSNN